PTARSSLVEGVVAQKVWLLSHDRHGAKDDRERQEVEPEVRDKSLQSQAHVQDGVAREDQLPDRERDDHVPEEPGEHPPAEAVQRPELLELEEGPAPGLQV